MHHVGPPLGQVPRNEGVDAVVPEDEVPEDAVGFLASRQEIRVVATDLDGFGAALLGDEKSRQPSGHSGHEEQGEPREDVKATEIL